MNVDESNLSTKSFGYLRYMICTNRKTIPVDLPSTSAAIQGHLLKVNYFTNISLKILDTTKPTLQLLNFCLREMLKKFLIRCACKASCGNRCACKKRENIRIVKI